LFMPLLLHTSSCCVEVPCFNPKLASSMHSYMQMMCTK
jgi:hypothetical protein